MEASGMRESSRRLVKTLGLPDPSILPLLDAALRPRDVQEVLDRFLTLYPVVAASYGFKDASRWLQQEELTRFSTPMELNFLRTGRNKEHLQDQVEALWALAWTLGYVERLEWNQPSANDFIKQLPDLKKLESSGAFRLRGHLRPVEQLAQALDNAYCIHWAIVELGLKRKRSPLRVEPYVISERRRALEWTLGEEDWDDVSLDT